MESHSTTMRFDGLVVLVTGAGRGLGRSHALAFAERGAHVIVHDAGVERDGSGGDSTIADAVVAEIMARGGTASAEYGNLETTDACRTLISRIATMHERLDILIHNAGLVRYYDMAGTDEATYRRIMRVNTDAPFWISQAALPLMRRGANGRIVITISGHGLVPAWARPDVAAYTVSKAALFGLMNQLAAEGAPHGILVNAVAPVAATRIFRRSVPVGELAPELVTPGVLYLASRQCAVTATVLHAAGGHFSLGSFCETDGADFGPTPTTPEVISARWSEISHGPMRQAT